MDTYAATGDSAYSATKAQYKTPTVQGSQKLAKPEIQMAIRKVQEIRLNNEALPKAIDFLIKVILDEKETTRNRLTAAKIVVDRTIGQGGDAGDDKEPQDMTAAELQARIDKLRREQSERAQLIVEHEPSGDILG